ncbi:MAG: DnrO protein [Rudaea sp.]
MAQVVFTAALFAVPATGRTQTQPATPAPATHAEHAHAAAPAAAVPAGKRWATDAPLRDGMRRVRQAVQALEHAEHGHLDATQTTNIAGLIDGAVNDMIANCKLDPDADAALHALLAKFLVGAHAARTGQGIPAALADMQGALKRYPLLFDDPGWDASAN